MTKRMCETHLRDTNNVCKAAFRSVMGSKHCKEPDLAPVQVQGEAALGIAP